MAKFKGIIGGFFKYKHLLGELVVRDIKVRYRRSFLGLLWTLLNPLLMMVVITLVFSHLFRFDIPNFPVYYLSGSILFSFTVEATTQAMSSIIVNANMIKKVYIPKYLFPFSKIVSCLVNLGFAFIAMLIVILITGAPLHVTILLSFLPIIYLFMFTTGLGLILSAWTVFFRDIAHFYSVVTMAWMYFTPIFYPATILPENLRWVLVINPMHHYIAYFRELVLYNIVPDFMSNVECFLMGAVVLVIGLFIFYRSQDRYILYI